MVKGQNQQLLPRHYLIMRMQLNGFSRDDIAEAVNLTPAAITLITSSDIYREEFKKLNDKANDNVLQEEQEFRRKIRELSIYGLSELETILKSKEASAKVKADIVFDLLDRDGIVAPDKDTDFASNYVNQLETAYRKRKVINDANASKVSAEVETKTFIPLTVGEPEPKDSEELAAA